MTDRWDQGDAYDRFMGSWSRPVAERFLDWLTVPAGADWLDVGTGTGALLQTIAATQSPARLAGADPSEQFLARARTGLPAHAEFRVGDAEHLPFGSSEFDAVVSGLVLNFVTDAVAGVAAMREVCRPGGTVAAYVWDYADGMRFLRIFWDAAVALNPDAATLDEGRRRFPLCQPAPLADLFADVGLADVETAAIEVERRFETFDDYWQPFLTGQGPAGTYVSGLPDNEVETLASLLRDSLPMGPDGSIRLTARAWAVRGTS